MEMRYSVQMAMEEVTKRLGEIEDAFAVHCERRYGAVEAVNCEDAETILVTSGTITSTSRMVIEDLRARGESVGLLKMKLFRPFPVELARQALTQARKVAVIDRNFSFGASGIFAQELRAALYNLPRHPQVHGYIAGLGGRDVTAAVIEDIYWRTKGSAFPEAESVWIGLQEVSP
jgi:pyruvate/2-oxoacid:ferredoxin oxidoreductase alpha subunit